MKVDIHTMEGLLRGKCLPAKMLVNESLAEYLVRQFDALHERAGAAERERDEAIAQRDKSGESFYKAVQYGAKLEAEIARRDAAVVEPVSWPDMPFSFEELEGMHGATFANGYVRGWARKCESVTMKGRLYTEAPPSVLPPELSMDDAPCHYGSNEACAWVSGANSMRELFSSPGAQPQKPVVLPHPFAWAPSGEKYFSEEQLLSLLDAAGITYEVKK